jgi:hypothetical protein
MIHAGLPEGHGATHSARNIGKITARWLYGYKRSD